MLSVHSRLRLVIALVCTACNGAEHAPEAPDAAADSATSDAPDGANHRADDACAASPADAAVPTSEGARDASTDAEQISNDAQLDAQLPSSPDSSALAAIDLALAEDPIEPNFLCGHPSLYGSLLMDPGHQAPVANVAIAGDRALTQDLQGPTVETSYAHWTLWNLTTRHAVADGSVGPNASYTLDDGAYPNLSPAAELKGNRMLIGDAHSGSYELRSAEDGALIANLSVPYAHLSNDGSYVWGIDTRLKTWSIDGELLLDLPKSDPAPIATATELRLLGEQGLERISLLDGSVRLVPATMGGFSGWFQDGERFFTDDDAGYTRIYSIDGVLEQEPAKLPTLYRRNGYGDWYFGFDVDLSTVHVYRVGSPVPVRVETGVRWLSLSGSILSLLRRVDLGSSPYIGHPQIDMIDLRSGAELATVRYKAPPTTEKFQVATDESGRWIASLGSLYVGDVKHLDQPAYHLGCSQVSSIAGSDAGIVSVAFANKLFLFNLLPSPQLIGTLDLSVYTQQISTDGQVLAVTWPGVNASDSPRFMRLPSGVPIELGRYAQPPYSEAGAAVQLVDVVLGTSAPQIAKVVCNRTAEAALGFAPSSCRADVTDFADNTISATNYAIPSSSTGVPIPRAISSSGQRLALSNGKVYDHGSFSGTVAGLPSDFLDEDRVLTTSGVYDVLGNKLSALGGTRAIRPDRLYQVETNTIRALSDGSITWQASTPASSWMYSKVGDVAGNQVVFVEDHPGQRILVQPY